MREKTRLVIDTVSVLHEQAIRHWDIEHNNYVSEKQHNIPTRYERSEIKRKNATKGDMLLKKVQDLFHHGMGIEWSEVQLRIFNAFIDSCLPKIYGDEWNEVKQRVMFQRGIDRIRQETLVILARRNGKTFVTSGTAAAMFLVIPNLSIAIFSVSERQSKMLMTSAMEKIEAAWEMGTHVSKQGYNIIERNKEKVVMTHPNGGKQVLGSYPGSVRVSNVSLLFFLSLSFFSLKVSLSLYLKAVTI